MSFTYTPDEPASLASQFINNTSQNVFLTGNAGTGKTTFLKHIVDHTHKKVAVVAPTGIAALNARGVTIHSMFQLPFGSFAPVRKLPFVQGHYGRIHDTDAIVKNMQMHENKRKVIRELEVLIVDEVSMLRSDLLDAMDFVMRFVRRRMNEPFGGVQMLFIGDMLQLPPVVKEEEWTHLRQYYKSPFFFDAQVLQKHGLVYVELEKIYRQSDERFVNLLNNLRNNMVSAEDEKLLNTYYKPAFSPAPDEGYITLTTHNYKADKQNKAALENLGGKTHAYRAKLEGEFNEYNFPVEESLQLKMGAQVMFIKNDPSEAKQFYNGKIGKVTELTDEGIKVQCAGESWEIDVPLYEWENNKYLLNDTTNEIETKKAGSFKHYPLKLAWAITVHKSQGLTFDKAIIDVQDAFAAGQIYVALSRLRSLDGLVLTSSVPSNAFRAEQSVVDFAKTKPEKEHLSEQVKTQTLHYLHRQLQRSFDFGPLLITLRNHANSYDKSEGRSHKQRNAAWAVGLATQAAELKSPADKFLAQVQYALQEKNDGYLQYLHERLSAAAQYFEPRLNECSSSIFQQMALVAEDSGVKEYLGELQEIELEVYEQLKNIRKCAALVKAIAEGRELTKAEVASLTNDNQRMQLALQAKEQIARQKKSGRISTTDKPSKRKTAKPKKEKGDSHRQSLVMFNEGKTLAEIAKERGLSAGTIFSHIAKFVQQGDVLITQLMTPEKITAIHQAMDEIGDELTTPVKAKLGDGYSFDEIRLVMNVRKKEKASS